MVVALVDAFVEMANELNEIGATLLLVNDSPDDVELAAELERSMPRLSSEIPACLLVNSENLGFLRAANRGMALARDMRRDVVLLNSDAIPRPGAFAEMLEVSRLDPMIGAVSPRSDNATICDSPYFDELRTGGRDAAYAAHRYVERYLPRYTYVPTTVGFCMLVRWQMLEEFGLFDEIYGAGYNEEIDFVRRFNRRGYRAVLANRAYVHHAGEVSFSRSAISRAELDEVNRSILYERYPECPKTIQKYFEGAEYQAQRLLGGLIPGADGRLNVLFDCRKLERYYSGTHEHMVALLRAFVVEHSDAYVSYILCDEGSFRFHGLDTVEGLTCLSEKQVAAKRFAAVMRIGQPFQLSDLELLESAAPVAGALMLDTIALDCQHLDDTGLDILWQRLCMSLDILGFNSRFSADQFGRRFAVPDRVTQFVSLCSTDVSDYSVSPKIRPRGDAILVVGNHFLHKHVEATVAAIRKADFEQRILVLGIKIEMDGVESYESGLLSDVLVASLYDQATVVLLPSHYEGFGLPILHGLAHGRPVIARNLPSAHEIKESCPLGANLHLASTTKEMVALALDPPPWRFASDDDAQECRSSWAKAADTLAAVIADGIERFDFVVCRSRRVLANTAKLRLELAASQVQKFMDLPDPGQGYMIGRELEDHLRSEHEALASNALAMWFGFATCRERDIMASVSKSGRQAGYLKLKAGDTSATFEDVQRHILAWFARLRIAGRIQLRLRESIVAGNGELDPMIAMRLLFISSGFVVDSLVREGRWLVMRGTKRDDWQAMLPGPPDNLHFVHYLYRRLLGRHPDTAGADNYVGELSSGHDRKEILKTFLCSPERHRLIGHQLARWDGREAAAH